MVLVLAKIANAIKKNTTVVDETGECESCNRRNKML